MEIGEKIKSFRDLKCLTQKELAEISGVSEISIRKYEAGDRKPKPSQLEKIANALGIGLNLLLDIDLNTLNIDTIGDFMAILFLLEDKIGISYTYEVDNKQTAIPESVILSFENPKINKIVSEWINCKNRSNLRSKIIQEEKLTEEQSLMMEQQESGFILTKKQEFTELNEKI